MHPKMKLNGVAIGIEHLVAGGTTLTGVASLKTATNRTTQIAGRQDDSIGDSVDRHMLVYDRADNGTPTAQGVTPGNGSGLFTPWTTFADTVGYHIYVADVNVRCPVGAVNWDVYLTSGLEDGDPTTIDDPALDMPLASGAGAGSARIDREILPGQNIRVVFAGAAPGIATDISRVAVLFAAYASDTGRYP